MIRKASIHTEGAEQIGLENYMGYTLASRKCAGCGGEGDGCGGTCRPTYTRAAFSLLFTTDTALEIATNWVQVSEHEDIHPQET